MLYRLILILLLSSCASEKRCARLYPCPPVVTVREEVIVKDTFLVTKKVIKQDTFSYVKGNFVSMVNARFSFANDSQYVFKNVCDPETIRVPNYIYRSAKTNEIEKRIYIDKIPMWVYWFFVSLGVLVVSVIAIKLFKLFS